MMSRQLYKENNALLFIPQRMEAQKWELGSDGLVDLIIPRRAKLDKFVRLFKRTPDFMRIGLDDHGSFVWINIDGKRNIWELGQLMNIEFGKEAEPVYARLTLYLRILKNNKFIIMKSHNT